MGIYEATDLIGVSGKTYTLTVETNGNIFTSTATMPAKVNMDSLYITEDYLFGETRKTANVEYQDPSGSAESYRFIQYVNGVKEKGYSSVMMIILTETSRLVKLTFSRR